MLDKKVIPVSDPKRGDVMVFSHPEDTRINYIKRVVGLPGDTITYTSDKRILVNGCWLKKSSLGDEPGSLGSARLYTEKLGEHEHYIRKEVRRRVELTRQWQFSRSLFYDGW